VEKSAQGLVLHSVLHTEYYSGIQTKNNEMAGACSTRGVGRGANRVLTGNPERKRPLAEPMRRGEDNIKNGSSRNGTGAGSGT